MDFKGIVGNAANRLTKVVDTATKPKGADQTQTKTDVSHEGPSYSGMVLPEGNTRGIAADMNAAQIAWDRQNNLAKLSADIDSNQEEFLNQRYANEIANAVSGPPMDTFDVWGDWAKQRYADEISKVGTKPQGPDLSSALDNRSAQEVALEDLSSVPTALTQSIWTTLPGVAQRGSEQQDKNRAYASGYDSLDPMERINSRFYDQNEFAKWAYENGYGYATPTDLRADGDAAAYRKWLDHQGIGAYMFGGMEGERRRDAALAKEYDNDIIRALSGGAGMLGGTASVAKDWDTKAMDYINPWWTTNEETYDIQNILDDKDTYETISGLTPLAASDFADWLLADRYGANGQLYNWASAVIPDYLQSIGAFDPKSESLDMFNASDLSAEEREQKRDALADALFMNRMNQILQSPGSESIGMDPGVLFDMLSNRAGGGYTTVSDSYSGQALNPSGARKIGDFYSDLGYWDDPDVVARDLMNIYDYTNGGNPYANERFAREAGRS